MGKTFVPVAFCMQIRSFYGPLVRLHRITETNSFEMGNNRVGLKQCAFCAGLGHYTGNLTGGTERQST